MKNPTCPKCGKEYNWYEYIGEFCGTQEPLLIICSCGTVFSILPIYEVTGWQEKRKLEKSKEKKHNEN